MDYMGSIDFLRLFWKEEGSIFAQTKVSTLARWKLKFYASCYFGLWILIVLIILIAQLIHGITKVVNDTYSYI